MADDEDQQNPMSGFSQGFINDHFNDDESRIPHPNEHLNFLDADKDVTSFRIEFDITQLN